MGANPLVSVVIPHFDRAELLAATVSSVLASTDDRFDIVIVDDGSCAAEWRRVEALRGGRVSVIRRVDGRKGPSRCRNLGVAASNGSFILFLDSDDLMAPWCIETRLAKTVDTPSADCWIFPVLQFREFPGDLNLLWNRMQTERDEATRFASSDPPWHTSGPLWRKDALQTFGGFNELVLYGDDSDMHLRALLSGIKTSKYPDELPDVFVRRSNEPRITNSLSPELIESRRVRLHEGTKLLKGRASTEHLACWEAQYFTEAEFLLFNHPESSEPVEKVLDAWEDEFRPQPVLR
ncbi:MAG TPA: glycosyltransferase family 2 protein, partial [Gemmatimonadaceae bacterium]|nr:glycosyltransferase family 2 protein [Gemmatimonadaceae bacterium]